MATIGARRTSTLNGPEIFAFTQRVIPKVVQELLVRDGKDVQ